MSSPNEIRVLRIVRESSEVTKRMLAKSFGITDDYAKYLLDSLHFKGFLENVAPGRYAITQKGVDELLITLLHIQGRLKAKVYRAAQQDERIDEKIAELADYRERLGQEKGVEVR
ncbi:MAG: hypothetical protein SCARUB_00547 [Candidatus Scalindua rubra]|uniref:ArnR1-like winged helix-turn-helix domain-containing protein n=1 Tax=Candidatus Scalindua rubra TaxID=1872076 RepID=A0A1E3XFB2_9BACT|nr:MAG: hypothetical protein SCARUB_00547 [Candidatus Scalindua rubra]